MEEEFPSLTTLFNPLFSMKIGSWQREREREGQRLQNRMQYYCSCASGRGQYFLQVFFFFFQIAAIIVFKIQEWSNMMATYFKDKHNQYPKPMTK
jgi:hypothetical protein